MLASSNIQAKYEAAKSNFILNLIKENQIKSMKLFLDSAITEEIAHALKAWDMDGLTTNPRHVMVSGKPFRTVIAEIAELVHGTDKPVSVEVNPHFTGCKEIVDQGRELAALSPNFVIKVGACEGGFTAIRELSKDGIRTNATLIMTVAQAWHAARAGASFISPFLGWKDQFGDIPDTLIADVRTMLDKFGYPAEIIAVHIALLLVSPSTMKAFGTHTPHWAKGFFRMPGIRPLNSKLHEPVRNMQRLE
jgi:transaldolase